MENAPSPAERRIIIGGLVVDFDRNTIEGPDGESRMEPKLSLLLSVLVENAGQVVTRDTLIERVWGGALGADQSLTNAVSQLRKLLSRRDEERGHIETVPKRGYRFTGIITPLSSDTVPRNVGAANAFSQTPERARGMEARRVAALVTLLLIGGGLFMLARGILDPQPHSLSAADKGRFHIVSAASDEDPPELRSQLAAMVDEIEHIFTDNALIVIEPGARADAAELIIRADLEEINGDMTAHIDVIETATRAKLWSLKMDRAAEEFDLFRADIAFKVADTMQCGLDNRRRMKTDVSAEAFALLVGLCDRSKASGGRWGQLTEMSRELTVLMPGTAEAYAQYGANLAFSIFFSYNLPLEQKNSIRTAAYENLRKALEIDPDNGRALWGLAIMNDDTVSLEARENYLRRALDADPGFYWTRNHMGHLLVSVGRRNDAAIYYKKFLDDFPLDRQRPVFFAREVMVQGEPEYARSIMEPLLDRFPGEEMARMNWLETEFWYGAPEKARHWIDTFDIDDGRLDCMNATLDARSSGNSLSEGFIDERCGRFSIDRQMLFYGYFGHVDRVFEILEDERDFFAEPSNVNGRRYLFERFLRPVHEDPRFMAFAVETGLAEYWLAQNEWPDFCEEDALAYDCREAARAALN